MTTERRGSSCTNIVSARYSKGHCYLSKVGVKLLLVPIYNCTCWLGLYCIVMYMFCTCELSADAAATIYEGQGEYDIIENQSEQIAQLKHATW